MSDLIPRGPDAGSSLATGKAVIDWSRLSDGARATLDEFTYSRETRRSYAWAWQKFCAWAEANGKRALPADEYDVASYLDALSRQTRLDRRRGREVPVSSSLVDLAASAIACAHLIAGASYNRAHPALRTMLRAIRRKLGTAPRRQRDALVADLIAKVVEPLGEEKLIDVRDRALTLVGFMTGRRRANLSALDVDHLMFSRDGVDVCILRSKTNQEGKPEEVSIPYQPEERRHLCAARCLRTWLDRAGIEEGPVFRAVDRWGHIGGRLAGQEVNRIVQKLCERAGLPGNWGSHSTRAGIITTLDNLGYSLTQIGQHVGQRDMNTTAGYVRRSGRYRRNVAKDIFRGGEP